MGLKETLLVELDRLSEPEYLRRSLRQFDQIFHDTGSLPQDSLRLALDRMTYLLVDVMVVLDQLRAAGEVRDSVIAQLHNVAIREATAGIMEAVHVSASTIVARRVRGEAFAQRTEPSDEKTDA